MLPTIFAAGSGALRALAARWRGRATAPLVLTCYGKPECPLCDKAKVPVGRIVGGSGGRIVAEWVNILDDATLRDRWGERIPVVCAGDTILAEGKVSEVWLRRAIGALPRGRSGPDA